MIESRTVRMRIVVRVLGFVLMVATFTVWSSLDRYVSPDLPLYRPVETLVWMAYMGAIILFTVSNPRIRAYEKYEVPGWRWLWAVAAVILGCFIWAVESIFQIRVAAWLVAGLYVTPLIVMGVAAHMRERKAQA